MPDGRLEGIEHAGEDYEAALAAAGGVELQLLGIGTDGHIGFNEPGSSFASLTRVKTLTEQTRRDNARFFDSIDDVPRHCITQGLGTILRARHLVLLAFGEGKAEAVAGAVEGPVTASLPGSAIQLHPHATVVIDEAAASRCASPTTTGTRTTTSRSGRASRPVPGERSRKSRLRGARAIVGTSAGVIQRSSAISPVPTRHPVRPHAERRRDDPVARLVGGIRLERAERLQGRGATSPISSCSSRARASAALSPVSGLPPGCMNTDVPCLRTTSTRPAASVITAALTKIRGPVVTARRPCRG